MFVCLIILAASPHLLLCIGSDMSLSFGKMALWSWCSVWSSGTIFLVTWVRCARVVPFVGYVCPPVVIEPWLLLAHWWVEDWLWGLAVANADEVLCRGRPHGAGFISAGLWCLLSPPLVCINYRAIGWCSGLVWRWLLVMLVLWPLGKGSSADHMVGAMKWPVVGRGQCWAWRHQRVSLLWTESGCY